MRRRKEPTSHFAAFETLKNDYAASKNSRFRRKRTGISLQGSNADYHYRTEGDYLRMLETARDMDRNDAIIGQAIDRAVINTVQNGFVVDPQTGDDKLDLELWNRWEDWSNDPDQCELSGELVWKDVEYLTLRQAFIDGDIFVLPTESGQVEIVESHRCRTPTKTTRNVVHGVLLDEHRRREEYWFTKRDIDPSEALRLVSDITPYPARNKEGHRQVFHIYNPKRCTQTRGVTALAPIFDASGMFEDINFARMIQQQIVSCFAIIRTKEKGTFGGPPSATGNVTTETRSDGSTRTLQGIAPGMEISGEEGESINGFSPSVPSPTFFDHMRLVLTLIGINIGLPLVMVLMDGSETNFSGYRGAVDQARMTFRHNQDWQVRRLHSPTYLWKVRQWMKADAGIRKAAAKSKINVFSHKWNPPTWPYIEPFSDANADLLRLKHNLISPRRLHAERGRDWDEIAEESIADNALAIKLAIKTAEEINKESDGTTLVHWRELLSLPAPEGLKIATPVDIAQLSLAQQTLSQQSQQKGASA